MPELWEMAKLIRSKNAGPWQLTIDIMFDTREKFDLVAKSPLGKRETYAKIYRIDEDLITLFLHEASMAIKVTFPRSTSAGAVNETDVFGGQFHSPLVKYQIEDQASSTDASKKAGKS
jgi:hypothetical protein